MWISEDILIQDLKVGNPKVQRLLYEKYKRRMYALCSRYCNTEFDAEDIAIQGFMKVFNKIEEFDGRNFEGWMKRIFVNEAINHFHKNKNQTWSHASETDENIAEDFNQNYDSLSMEELNLLIFSLPEGCKVVFNLYAIEGYKHNEIGQMLGISESTSKSQYIRAKQLLQNKVINKTAIIWKTGAI
jgi:RNA polymerase sigma-70 factor (ECF subfamily)